MPRPLIFLVTVTRQKLAESKGIGENDLLCFSSGDAVKRDVVQISWVPIELEHRVGLAHPTV